MSYSVTQSTTRTKDPTKAVITERPFDCLYDPVYTVSSEVDRNRAILKAYATTVNYRKVVDFESIFSSQPRYTLKLDAVPSYANDWRGRAEQCKEVLQKLAGVNPNPHKCPVTGADYWKYIKSPVIPFEQSFPPDVVFEFSGEDFEASEEEQQPAQRTVGVQTDYRENETQTDPYSPEYVLHPGTGPSELLQLASLTWGHGLPAGLAEVEMIERMRAKQVWEASLPPMHDLSQLDKRRRMMVEMEAKEWAFREEEIQKLHDARLAVLMDLRLQGNEAENEAAYNRLTQIYAARLREKDLKLEKIHKVYMRSLRKLEAKRMQIEGKLQQVGVEKSFKQRKKQSKDIKTGKKSAVEKAVKKLNDYKALSEEEAVETKEKRLRLLIKKEKPPPAAVTPTVETPPEEDEQTEFAVICLQKLLRGRRTQYEMFQGKENNQELIRELRKLHTLQSEEQELNKAEKKHIMTLKEKRDEQMNKALQEEACQAAVVGQTLTQLFDSLSKELVLLQEERRIHAFTLMAERERRKREAEESGRRQLEERRRREGDEIFRQIVQVHQESVDMYLEDIILGYVERVADEQSREEIRRKAEQLNDVAYALEKSLDSCQSEEIVSELVYSFLIPEVEKINIRKRVHLKQQRHLEAAQSIIQGLEAPTGTHRPESPQVTISGVGTSRQAEDEMNGQEKLE
ncbi:PREDICTED: protein MAATS1 isoform X1 [Cyprinodon variegatus]|uniref:protein MAATS1 isoform X1 n=1 Tax=Cyprinodon variegatus TaxID=28743 RepID=UPI000742C7A8|nr:PREDICTED: protein MAATS1 isoform X1 [Cyprinodon variegatus]